MAVPVLDVHAVLADVQVEAAEVSGYKVQTGLKHTTELQNRIQRITHSMNCVRDTRPCSGLASPVTDRQVLEINCTL